MIKMPKEYLGNYSEELSEKDVRDISNLTELYVNRFKILNACVKENVLSYDEAMEAKIYFAKQYSAEVFLIPRVNRLSSKFENLLMESFGSSSKKRY